METIVITSESQLHLDAELIFHRKVREVVIGIIDSARLLLETEHEDDLRIHEECTRIVYRATNGACERLQEVRQAEGERRVRKYVLDVIESCSLSLDEMAEVPSITTSSEFERTSSPMSGIQQASRDIVSAVVSNAQSVLDMERTDMDSGLLETARNLTSTAVGKASERLIGVKGSSPVSPIPQMGEAQLKEKASELVANAIVNATRSIESIGAMENEMNEETRMTKAAKELTLNAIAAASKSIERMKLSEDIELAVQQVVNEAVLASKKSLGILSDVKGETSSGDGKEFAKVLSEYLSGTSMEAAGEEVVWNQAAKRIAKRAIEAATTSIERMEITVDSEKAAREVAQEAILAAKRSLDVFRDLRQEHEEELQQNAEEIVRHAVLSAENSLERLHKKDMHDVLGFVSAAKQEMEVEDDDVFLKAEADEEALGLLEGKVDRVVDELSKHAIVSAENSIERFFKETLTEGQAQHPGTELSTTAINLAIRAVVSAETSLQRMETIAMETDKEKRRGEVMWFVMSYVEGIINFALNRVRDLRAVEQEEYVVVTQEEAYQATAEYPVSGIGKDDIYLKEVLALKASRVVNDVLQRSIDIVLLEMVNDSFFMSPGGSTDSCSEEDDLAHKPKGRPRGASVHFSERSIMFTRRESYVPRETDFFSVLNRPPTPIRRSQLSSTEFQDEEDEEEEQEEDTTTQMFPFSGSDARTLRRHSSDLGVKTVEGIPPEKPNKSASEPNIFECAGSITETAQTTSGCTSLDNMEKVKQGPQECDELLSVGTTTESCFEDMQRRSPLQDPCNNTDAEKEQDPSLKHSISNILASHEGKEECEISPNSSYVLLPPLHPSGHSLIVANTEETGQMPQHKPKSPTGSTGTLPAISPTRSLVGILDSSSDASSKDTIEAPQSGASVTHLPAIAQSSGALVTSSSSVSGVVSQRDSKENVLQEPLKGKGPSMESASVSLRASEILVKSSLKKSQEALKVSLRTSKEAIEVSPRSSAQVSPVAVSASHIQDKQLLDEGNGARSQQSKRKTEKSKPVLSPQPSTKVLGKKSSESSMRSRRSSEQVTKLSPRSSKKELPLSRTTSKKEVSRTSSSNSRKSVVSHHDVSPRPSSKTVEISPKSSKKESKFAPEASEGSECSSEDMNQTPSSEAVKLPPKSSQNDAVQSKSPKEASPRPSVQAVLSARSSKKDAKLSPRPSKGTVGAPKGASKQDVGIPATSLQEAVTVTPRASKQGVKVATRLSKETALSPKQSSGNVTRTHIEKATEKGIVAAAAAGTHAKVLQDISKETVKVQSVERTEDATNSSDENIRISERKSKETTKALPTSSKEAIRTPARPSGEAIDISSEASKRHIQESTQKLHEPIQTSSHEVAAISPHISDGSVKAAKPSGDLGKGVSLSNSRSSRESIRTTSRKSVTLSSRASRESGKHSAKNSRDSIPDKRPSKQASEARKVQSVRSPKASKESAVVSPSSSSEASKGSPHSPKTSIKEIPSAAIQPAAKRSSGLRSKASEVKDEGNGTVQGSDKISASPKPSVPSFPALQEPEVVIWREVMKRTTSVVEKEDSNEQGVADEREQVQENKGLPGRTKSEDLESPVKSPSQAKAEISNTRADQASGSRMALEVESNNEESFSGSQIKNRSSQSLSTPRSPSSPVTQKETPSHSGKSIVVSKTGMKAEDSKRRSQKGSGEPLNSPKQSNTGNFSVKESTSATHGRKESVEETKTSSEVTSSNSVEKTQSMFVSPRESALLVIAPLTPRSSASKVTRTDSKTKKVECVRRTQTSGKSSNISLSPKTSGLQVTRSVTTRNSDLKMASVLVGAVVSREKSENILSITTSKLHESGSAKDNANQMIITSEVVSPSTSVTETLETLIENVSTVEEPCINIVEGRLYERKYAEQKSMDGANETLAKPEVVSVSRSVTETVGEMLKKVSPDEFHAANNDADKKVSPRGSRKSLRKLSPSTSQEITRERRGSRTSITPRKTSWEELQQSSSDHLRIQGIVPFPPAQKESLNSRSSSYSVIAKVPSSQDFPIVSSHGSLAHAMQPSPPSVPKPQGLSPQRSRMKTTSSDDSMDLRPTQSETSIGSSSSDTQDDVTARVSEAWLASRKEEVLKVVGAHVPHRPHSTSSLAKRKQSYKRTPPRRPSGEVISVLKISPSSPRASHVEIETPMVADSKPSFQVQGLGIVKSP